MTPPADIDLQVQDSLLTRLLTYTEAPGREGVALPYTLREDDGITVLVLLCAFLLVVAVPRSARFLSSQLRNIFSTRERSSLFADEAHVDSRYRLMLTLHTCVVAGVLAFSLLTEQSLAVRLGSLGAGLALGVVIAWFSPSGKRLLQYGRQSYEELRRVVWPTKKETLNTTGLVMAFVVLMAFFLFICDKIIEWGLYDVLLRLSF